MSRGTLRALSIRDECLVVRYWPCPLVRNVSRYAMVSPDQLRSAQISPDQPRSAQISSDQLRSAQIRSDRPRSVQIIWWQNCRFVTNVSWYAVGSVHLRRMSCGTLWALSICDECLEVPRSTQISPDQLRSVQISPDQLRSAQISSDQLRSAQISSDQLRSALISSYQCRSGQISPGQPILAQSS